MAETKSNLEDLKHYGEELSISPFSTSLSILLSMLGFITAFSWNHTILGLILGGTGVAGIIISLFGWVSEVATKKDGESLSPLAMIIFILSETALFGGLFSSYLYNILPADRWPPPGTPSSVPPLGFALVLTLLLLISSVTMQLAEINIEKGNSVKFASNLIFTILLGTVFISGQINEWTKLMREGFTPMINSYGTFFFTITGLHGSHVLVGVLLQVFILFLSKKNTSLKRNAIVKACGYYWHFVDGVWLFVLLFIYVLPARGF